MLVGGKVRLDVIDPKNIEWMRLQRNDPEMRQYFREWKEISKDQQQKWYSSRGNNTDVNHVYFEVHAVNQEDYSQSTSEIMMLHGHNPDKSLVGCLGIHYVDWRLRSGEFGIFLAKDVRGKGLGKEALVILFDYGFREMNLHKIWAEVYEFNQALDVYTKGLGMHVDGMLRHSQFCDGRYINSTMLSVLEDEWFEAHGGR